MKKSIILGLAVLGFTATTASAQSSANVDAYARVIRPVSVSFYEELNFGSFYATNAAQVVTITPDHSSTAENNALRNVPAITTQGAGIDASADPDNDGIEQGQVLIQGEAGFAYSITVTGGPMTTTSTTPNNGPMGLSAFKVAAIGGAGAAIASPASVTFPGVATTFQNANAFTYYNVGGSMSVAANQGAGIYHGVINVAAAYN